jgi:2-amino-4-hydroxy-6-hydroxymethyldihydropteridine diphosphokinase
MNQAIISIGSNIEAEVNIAKALAFLAEDVEIVKQASVLTTAPIGITNQPAFSNSAVLVRTLLDEESLKQLLKTVENRCGRDRSRPKFGPREIDLDILIWNGKIVDDDYYTRDFLRDLAEELLG